MNGGRVYAAYDYDAAMDDELSFKEGDELVVLKRDDGPQSPQKGWWCAKDPKIDKEGFVPRNYLAVSLLRSLANVRILHPPRHGRDNLRSIAVFHMIRIGCILLSFLLGGGGAFDRLLAIFVNSRSRILISIF